MGQEKQLKPGWQQVKFGDVVKLSTARCSDPASEGIERYVGLEHIDSNDLRIRRWGLVEDGITFTTRFKPGQVLFGKRRAYLRKVAIADFEGICSGDIYVFESADPEVLLPELLPFICQTEQFFEYAIGTSAGSLSPRTNWKSLVDFEFSLPSLNKQKQLLNLVSASTATVNSLRTVLEEAAKCLAAVRESYFSNEKCKIIQLEDLLSDIQAGKSLLGTEVNVPNGKNAVLKVSAVGREGFRPEESKVLVNQDDFLSQFSVRSGDLLITRANTPELVGMSCLVDRDYPNLMLSDKTLRLVPKVNAPKMLLLEALRTAKFRQQLQSAATGTGAAMKNISQAKLRELSVFWPIEIENSETFLGNIQQFRNSYAGIRQRLHDVEKRHHILTNSVLGEG